MFTGRHLRLTFVIVMVAGLIAGSAMAETWVSFGTDSQYGNTASLMAPVSGDTNSLIVVETPGVFVRERVEGETVYQELEIPGYGSLRNEGLPQVPAVRKFVAIPNETGVVLEVISSDYKPIDGNYLVWPSQPYTLENEAPAPFAIDANFYQENVTYPQKIATVSEPMLWRNLRVVALDVYPVRYNPAKGTLESASKISLRLKYEGTNLRNSLKGEVSEISPLLVPSYKRAVVNYSQQNLVASPQGTDDGLDYLILADPEMLAAVQPLADFHSANGLSVSVVDVSTVGSSTTDIKAFIQAEYDSVSPAALDYVLFAADVDVIPFYSWDGNPSDSWYSFLAGDDWLQEVAIGRIPAQMPVDMTTVVNKLLVFEGGINEGDWNNNVSLIAHKEQYPGKYTECSESIRTFAYSSGGPNFDTIYGGESGTNAVVSQRVNEGRGIVNYRGHGSETTWSGWDVNSDSYTVAMAQGLANGVMTPVVFSIACLNMALSGSSVSFAEAWFMQAQGAVAFLGATKPSYTIPNHDFDKNLFKAVYDKGIPSIGYVSNDANYDLVLYGGHGSLSETNIKMYLWLGDPALEVVSVECNGCYIDGACYNDGTVNPDNSCQMCDLAYSVNDWKAINEGLACVTSNLCLSNTTCTAGECLGDETVCNDANVCTDDVCDPATGNCTFPFNMDPCDDGLFCNGTDECSGGWCSNHNGDPCTGWNETCSEETNSCEGGGLCGIESETSGLVSALLVLIGMMSIGFWVRRSSHLS